MLQICWTGCFRVGSNAVKSPVLDKTPGPGEAHGRTALPPVGNLGADTRISEAEQIRLCSLQTCPSCQPFVDFALCQHMHVAKLTNDQT